VKAVAVAAALAFLTGCSSGAGTSSGAPVATTAAPATEPTSSTSSTSTTEASSTTTAPRATTTVARLTPEASAKALFAAWTAGDRAAAAKVAQASAVDTLFARAWRAADGWAFSECSGAAGSTICTWKRTSGEQLLMRVQNATGGGSVSVAEIRFQA